MNEQQSSEGNSSMVQLLVQQVPVDLRTKNTGIGILTLKLYLPVS